MLGGAEIWLRYIGAWQNMRVYCYGWVFVKAPFVDGVLLLAYRNI